MHKQQPVVGLTPADNTFGRNHALQKFLKTHRCDISSSDKPDTRSSVQCNPLDQTDSPTTMLRSLQELTDHILVHQSLTSLKSAIALASGAQWSILGQSSHLVTLQKYVPDQFLDSQATRQHRSPCQKVCTERAAQVLQAMPLSMSHQDQLQYRQILSINRSLDYRSGSRTNSWQQTFCNIRYPT